MSGNPASSEVLVALNKALDGGEMSSEVVLWGGWARWFITKNPSETRKDVDVILSRRVCENFYKFSLELYKQGFRNVWRIKDDNLNAFLVANGVKQNPLYQRVEHGLSWRFANGINLDINIEPSDFEFLQGHESWKDPNGEEQTRLIKTFQFWRGCSVVFKDPIRSELGILSPTRESQLHLYQLQLTRANNDPWFKESGIESSRLQKNIDRLSN